MKKKHNHLCTHCRQPLVEAFLIVEARDRGPRLLLPAGRASYVFEMSSALWTCIIGCVSACVMCVWRSQRFTFNCLRLSECYHSENGTVAVKFSTFEIFSVWCEIWWNIGSVHVCFKNSTVLIQHRLSSVKRIIFVQISLYYFRYLNIAKITKAFRISITKTLKNIFHIPHKWTVIHYATVLFDYFHK